MSQIMNPNSENQFVLPIEGGFSSDGKVSKILRTSKKYVDKDIKVDVNVPKVVWKAQEGGTADNIAINKTDSQNIIAETGTTTNYPIVLDVTASVQGGTIAVATPGWIGTDGGIKIEDVDGQHNETIYIKESSLSNTKTGAVEYEERNDIVININDGYLYINEGYTPATKVSLGTLIPDIDDDASAPYIVNGMKAYDENGAVITGTMPNSNAHSQAGSDPVITVTKPVISVVDSTPLVIVKDEEEDKFNVTIEAETSGTTSTTITQGYIDEDNEISNQYSGKNTIIVSLDESIHSDTVGTATISNAETQINMAKSASVEGYDLDGIMTGAPTSGAYVTISAEASQKSAGTFSNKVTCVASEGYTKGYNEEVAVTGEIGVSGSTGNSYISLFTGEFDDAN